MPKGRKHKKKKIDNREAEKSELTIKKAKQKAAFKKNRKYILPLVLNTVVFFGLYSYLVEQPKLMMPTLWAYFVLTAGFCFSYVIYNRGFSRMKLTPDMLPDSMSMDEKMAFIEDGQVRIERSKWMLTIIFPLLMTFILDILNMYILEPMLDLAASVSMVAVISLIF
jgi:hypothetical protein